MRCGRRRTRRRAVLQKTKFALYPHTSTQENYGESVKVFAFRTLLLDVLRVDVPVGAFLAPGTKHLHLNLVIQGVIVQKNLDLLNRSEFPGFPTLEYNFPVLCQNLRANLGSKSLVHR